MNNLVGTDKDSLRTSSQSGEADLSTSLEDKDSLIAPGIQYESNANVSTPQEENPIIDDLPPKSRVVHKSGSARDLNIHSENMNLSYDENPTVNKVRYFANFRILLSKIVRFYAFNNLLTLINITTIVTKLIFSRVLKHIATQTFS